MIQSIFCTGKQVIKLTSNVSNRQGRIKKIFTNNCVNFSTLRTTTTEKQKQLMAKSLPKQKPIPGVESIIMVSSGKGGVGKSTTAVNLAVALKENHPQKSIGLLDADVFGPSVPLLMNLNDTPLLTDDNLMIPLSNYGVKCMSMGFLVGEGAPLIWRGLMVMQALERLMRQVSWGKIDILVVDTPPGTGDTHLSLIQNLPITGAVLITTPQTAAIQVTSRGATMLSKLHVPIVGLVENMTSVTCPTCSTEVSLYGKSSILEKFVSDINAKVIARVPLAEEISTGSDRGVPIVIEKPNSVNAKVYKEMALAVHKFVEERLNKD